MRKYEIMLAIRGSLAESDAKKVYDEIIKHLKKDGSEISLEDSWGKLDTAYKIKQETDAYYYVVHFTFDGTNIGSLEKELEINKDVIRSIIVKLEKEDYVPYTREQYDEEMELYYQEKQDRQIKAMPKTRATTAAALEKEMKAIQKGKKPTKPGEAPKKPTEQSSDKKEAPVETKEEKEKKEKTKAEKIDDVLEELSL